MMKFKDEPQMFRGYSYNPTYDASFCSIGEIYFDSLYWAFLPLIFVISYLNDIVFYKFFLTLILFLEQLVSLRNITFYHLGSIGTSFFMECSCHTHI